MKNVSDAYTLGMAQPLRKRSYIQISLVSGGVTYTFDDNDISSAQKVSDVDPLSRRLPKETFTFSVFDYNGDYNPANPSGKWNDALSRQHSVLSVAKVPCPSGASQETEKDATKGSSEGSEYNERRTRRDALDENAALTVKFGFEVNGAVEWLSPDYYLLDGKPTVSGGIATFKASSKLSHLTGTFYKGVCGSKSLYSLACEVLADAGLTASEYEVDSSLQSIFTTSPMPISSYQNCLQMIAHAARCSVFTESAVIRIVPFSVAVAPADFVIGLDSIENNGDRISKIETLYKVQAYKYEYSADTELSVLFKAAIDVDGTLNYHAEYDTSAEQSVSISGGTLSDIHTYAGAADFTVTGSGTFTVTITGKKISSSASLSESVVSQNTNGSTDTEKNPLITDYTMQSALIYHVANYLQYRLTHTVAYRGNPELESGDELYLQTVYGSYISVLALSHTINYNGALSGTLVLKSLTEIENAYLYDSDSLPVVDVSDESVEVIGTSDYVSEYTSAQIDEFIGEVIN